jgi:hypothetical protein
MENGSARTVSKTCVWPTCSRRVPSAPLLSDSLPSDESLDRVIWPVTREDSRSSLRLLKATGTLSQTTHRSSSVSPVHSRFVVLLMKQCETLPSSLTLSTHKSEIPPLISLGKLRSVHSTIRSILSLRRPITAQSGFYGREPSGCTCVPCTQLTGRDDDSTDFWGYLAENPESIHQVMVSCRRVWTALRSVQNLPLTCADLDV